MSQAPTVPMVSMTATTVSSVHGMSYLFKAMVATNVANHSEVIRECRAQGCVLVSEITDENIRKLLVGAEAAAVVAGTTADEDLELGADERQTKLVQAIAELVAAGDQGNFAAGGKPKTGPLEDLVGFKVSAQERDAAFKIYSAEA